MPTTPAFPDPVGVIDGVETWACMVCGDVRPDPQVSVSRRRVPGMEDAFPDARVNVLHCVDRLTCISYATQDGPWRAPEPVLEALRDLTNPDLVHRVTPDLLRALVTGAGGRTIESDHRYTAEQHGDGEQGVLTLWLCPADSDEIGKVAFGRSRRTDGTVVFRALDFRDYRGPGHKTGGWVHRNPDGLVNLLAAFTPTH